MEPVEPPRAFGAVGDEAGLLEQAQMARDRGAADRQCVGELLDRAVTGAQQLEDRAPLGVAERVEGVAVEGLESDRPMVTRLLP